MKKNIFLLLTLAISSSTAFAGRTVSGLADEACDESIYTFQHYWGPGDLDIDLTISDEDELVTTFTSQQQPNFFNDIIYSNVGHNELFVDSMVEAIKNGRTMRGCIGESGEITSLVIQSD